MNANGEKMILDKKLYDNYVKILENELVPALGCTEPIAIAYAGAVARKTLGNLPEQLDIKVSGNIIKNVKSVVVPNTNGLKGIEAAVAAGIVAGNTNKLLEVIADVKDEEIAAINEFLKRDCIEIKPLDSEYILDIKITLFEGDHYASVRIVDSHTNIILIEKDNKSYYYPLETTAFDDLSGQYLNEVK